MNKTQYEQLVLVQFRNTEPFVYKFISKKPITIDQVAAYMIKYEDFNEDKDAITFIDQPSVVELK